VPGSESSGEAVWLALRLPTTPTTELRIDMSTLYSEEARRGLTPPRPNLAAYESDEFKSTIHRDAKRTVSGMAGEEWIEGITTKELSGYDTSVDTCWHYPGEIQSPAKPLITAEFNISYETAIPPSPWGGFPPKKSPDEIGKDEFMALWDTILGSLRLRPGAF